jgi:M6 family metalloprotease-like protein
LIFLPAKNIYLSNRWYNVSFITRVRVFGVLFTLGFIFLSALFFCAPVTYANPVWGEIFKAKQPNGDIVEVRVWGDEFYRVVESMDGYTLVRDADTDVICYARLSDDGNSFVSTGVDVNSASGESLGLQPHLRINVEARWEIIRDRRSEAMREERRILDAAGIDIPARAPDNGNVKGICLIVDFSDEVATIPANEIEDYCNMVGYTGYGNNGSVRDYFFDVSDGSLIYTNYVPSAYYRAQHPKSYYDDCNAPYGQRARELIQEALQDLDDNGFDFSQYDSDGDGRIDGINCFYAGVSGCPWAEGLWPHSSSVSFSADGVSAYRYQITGIGSTLRLSTFCHENGHMICWWPDLYDYGYESNGVGKFCLMCYSTSSTNPQEPCAYLKSLSGWTTTHVLTSPQAGVTVPSDVNTIYKYNHPTNPKEYYLIENRQKAGRDLYLPDDGLAIWHIDEDGSNNNEQMTPALHYEATLVQADGNWDLENDVNNGDATDLWSFPGYTECTPFSVPNTNWWDGSNSELKITEISTGSPLMTFNFNTVCPAQPSILDFGSVPIGCYADASLTIRNDSTGTLTGDVTESCDHYSILSGGGPFSLATGESLQVAVRFEPTAMGTHDCTLGIGGAGYCDVYCTGEGLSATDICEVQPKQLDFGSIAMGDSVDLDFTIYNIGCTPLTGSVSEGCMQYEIVVGGGSYSIDPSDSLVVTVRFKPTLIGSWPCAVQTGTLCANVSCTGVAYEPPPTCMIEPDTLDFGDVEVAGFKMMTFDITNTGYGTLLGTMSEACPYFDIVTPPDGGYSLTHGQSQTVTVLFFPGLEGFHECTIAMGNDACTDVYCLGAGISETPPTCSIDPDTLDFGTVSVGDSDDLTFSITNTGGDTLSGAVSETCDHYDIIAGGGAYALAAGETVFVTVRFEPGVSGNHTCSIETGSGLCGDVHCTGDGMDPAMCNIDPDILDFGVVTIGDSLDLAFIIANGGGDVLSGDVSEMCEHFSIVSGAGAYALAADETLAVTVRFKPGSIGFHECTIETGGALCTDVYCSGTGESPPLCVVEPDTLDYGIVIVGDSLDMSFDIINAGGGILSGSASDTCSYYDVVAGGGAYAVSAGETLHVTVRFKPQTDGSFDCRIETGADCGDVYCTGEGDDVSGLGIVNAKRFFLYQNYPNPFNPVTNIMFTVPGKAHTSLSIYNIEGRLVKTLVDGEFEGGVKTVAWDGRDARGNLVSTGVYLYRLKAGGNTMTRKMILLK